MSSLNTAYAITEPLSASEDDTEPVRPIRLVVEPVITPTVSNSSYSERVSSRFCAASMVSSIVAESSRLTVTESSVLAIFGIKLKPLATAPNILPKRRTTATISAIAL